MPYLKKATRGSDSFGHTWEVDGAVVLVDPAEAVQLMALPGHDFTEVLPGGVVQMDQQPPSHATEGETPDGQAEPGPDDDPLLEMARQGDNRSEAERAEDDVDGKSPPADPKAVEVVDADPDDASAGAGLRVSKDPVSPSTDGHDVENADDAGKGDDSDKADGAQVTDGEATGDDHVNEGVPVTATPDAMPGKPATRRPAAVPRGGRKVATPPKDRD